MLGVSLDYWLKWKTRTPPILSTIVPIVLQNPNAHALQE